jgi:hypothetical protein
MSLEEALDIYDEVMAEPDPGEPGEEPPQEPVEEAAIESTVAEPVAQLPYPRHYYVCALTQLVLDGVYTTHQLVKWEAFGWKDVPKEAWALAVEYLDTHPQFLASLKADVYQWSLFTPPAATEKERYNELRTVAPKTFLSRKQIRELRRPRPKDQNRVYKFGAKPPLVWTLDADFSQIEKLLAATQKGQAEGAQEALRVAEVQKTQLEMWFQQRMAAQEQKIQSLKASIESWSNPAPTDIEERAQEAAKPKRDSKGRFLKG